MKNLLICFFCCRYNYETDYLIAGQYCFICADCVKLCNKLIFNNIYNKKIFYLYEEGNEKINFGNSSFNYFKVSNIKFFNYDKIDNTKFNNIKKFNKNYIFNNYCNINYFDYNINGKKFYYNNYFYSNKLNLNNNYSDNYKKDFVFNKFLLNLPKPKVIYSYLNKYVIGQEITKKILSVAVYNHFKKVKFNLLYGYNLPKNNILMVGPSGSGKTFLVQTLSRILNVPFVIADATCLTEAGYIGEDVENILQRLYYESDCDIYKTEMGIIYIDEIDKIGRKNSNGNRDVSGEGVQQALLKFVEGTICSIYTPNNRKNNNQNFININTENILFICGGAFYGLDDAISCKDKKFSIGIKNEINFSKKNKSLELNDLIDFGIIPELIGRLPVLTKLNELTIDNLAEILVNSENSIINQYNILLSVENIVLKVNLKSIKLIAKIAYEKKLGARGLRNVIDNILLKVIYEIPQLDTLKEIVIHEHIFNTDKRPLLIHKDFYNNLF